jgi:hypothetical protein
MLLLVVPFVMCQVLPPGIAVDHCRSFVSGERAEADGPTQLSLYRITGLLHGGLPFSLSLGLNMDLAVKSFH